jgi:hypothetical protein
LAVHNPIAPDPTSRSWKGQSGRTTTLNETLGLHRQGLSPAQIAQTRGLSERTIYGHLARLIAEGEVALESIVSPDVITQVRAVATELGAERLAPIKERLPDTITYEQIRCVIASLGQGAETSQSESAGSSKYPGQTGPRHTVIAESSVYDEALFETLRQWRTAQARELKVPPYVIFHDRVLRSIAANLPTDPEALRTIPGVGRAKLERYGHTVLAIVQAHLADAGQATSSPDAISEPEAAASPTARDPVDVILAAVADLQGLLSRSGLANLLAGPPSDRVAPYRDHPLYGVLHADWGRQELTAEIDRLIAEGYLTSRRDRLVLSPAGQARLRETPP